MTERIEERNVQTHGDHIHEEHILHDLGADARRKAYQVSSLLWTFFGIIIGSIGLRVFLKLIAANTASPFARLVYSFTDLLVWPFLGLTSTPSAGGFVLDIPAIVAMMVYALIGWAVYEITWLILYRS
jgi:hypothetical protein